MANPAIDLGSQKHDESSHASPELDKINRSRELVFGIVGHVGSGTSTVANDLGEILGQQKSDDQKQEEKYEDAHLVECQKTTSFLFAGTDESE